MSFNESFKRLNKLCSDCYGEINGVTAYLNLMKQTPNGQNYVQGWNEDYATLKKYRDIRNAIAHDPGCTEEDLCTLEDERWLDCFYARIIKQTDPLTLYRKARQFHPSYHLNPPPIPQNPFCEDLNTSDPIQPKNPPNPARDIVFLLILTLILLACVGLFAVILLILLR